MGWAFNKFVDSFDTISNPTVNIESERHSLVTVPLANLGSPWKSSG